MDADQTQVRPLVTNPNLTKWKVSTDRKESSECAAAERGLCSGAIRVPRAETCS